MSSESETFQPVPFCACCDRTYRHIESHYRTRKHQRNAESSKTECEICNSPTERFVKCSRCVHYWCVTCQPQIQRCPFCRLGTPVQVPAGIPIQLGRIRPRVRRIFLEMERWRRRIRPSPHDIAMVRLSWQELGCVTQLISSATESQRSQGLSYTHATLPGSSTEVPSTYQTMVQMERWRLRLAPNPFENVLVRVTWNEIAYITYLFMSI